MNAKVRFLKIGPLCVAFFVSGIQIGKVEEVPI